MWHDAGYYLSECETLANAYPLPYFKDFEGNLKKAASIFGAQSEGRDSISGSLTHRTDIIKPYRLLLCQKEEQCRYGVSPKKIQRRIIMSSKNNNKLNVPEARDAMNKFKMECANEVGVDLKQGYNGDLTSRQAGSVGGQMVKRMIESYEQKAAE